MHTLAQTLAKVQVAKFKDTRCDVKGLAMVHVLVQMLAGKKSRHTRCNVQVLVKVLVKTLALRLAEVKAKTVSDTLDHVKAKALVNKFPLTLADMKAKTTGGILSDVESEGLVDRTADTLQEIRVRINTAY